MDQVSVRLLTLSLVPRDVCEWMCVCLRNSYSRGGRYFGPRLQVREMQAAAGQPGGGCICIDTADASLKIWSTFL